jgi:hypothetical protein
MTCYRIVAYRESGPVSQCPTKFTDLESAIFCAEIALYHFDDGYKIAIEETLEDGSEQVVRSSDYHPARDPAANSAAG